MRSAMRVWPGADVHHVVYLDCLERCYGEMLWDHLRLLNRRTTAETERFCLGDDWEYQG